MLSYIFESSTLFLIILIILLLVSGIVLYFVIKKPAKQECQSSNDVKFTNGCHIPESSFDSTIPSASGSRLSLVSFKSSQGAGDPITTPHWYRFRYVNTKTGEYGELSEWTKSGIVAGSSNLPCDGVCGKDVISGEDGNDNNQIKVGISESQIQVDPYKLLPGGGFLWLNVHRYVGDYPEGDGEIVGFLTKEYINGNVVWSMTDIEDLTS